MDALVIALFSILVGSHGAMWYKLGELNKTIVKASCPFGKCPIFERSKSEAAPEREHV